MGLEDFRYSGPEREAAREPFVGMDFPSLANRLPPEPSRPAESHAWHVLTTREQYEDFLRELSRAAP